jgi:hypothetical protein
MLLTWSYYLCDFWSLGTNNLTGSLPSELGNLVNGNDPIVDS